MKKFLIFAPAMLALSVGFTGCKSDDSENDEPEVPAIDPSQPAEEAELRVLTFEDEDYKGGDNYLGKTGWTSLIDEKQYGGVLLYGDMVTTQYRWHDAGNTELAAAIAPDGIDAVYWSGGEAISNYKTSEGDLANVNYERQLETIYGGADGSKNFCVHNGYFDGLFYTAPQGGIWFADYEPRVIVSMDVALTSYGINIALNGNQDFGIDPASETDWVKIVAIGTDIKGEKHETEITLMKDGKPNQDWVKWQLAELGEIVRLDFNIMSSMVGEYGMNFPGYFAYDNVTVKFSK